MSTAESTLWGRFKKYYFEASSIGLRLDVSRMDFPDSFFEQMKVPMRRAFEEMKALEAGGMANADESRMVGHYWLRTPRLCPHAEIRTAITETLAGIKAFATDVHAGKITSPGGGKFTHLLVIGIGGSALGPQFVTDALGGPEDRLSARFIDNTDPDGVERTFAWIGANLPTTLTVVISKSGGTAETRNGMLEAKHRYQNAGLAFERCAVAITQQGSELDKLAEADRWVKRFPMWDWVGGRTSELSAVGLLPAALQGYDIDAILAGAASCDEITRADDAAANPAALLAMMWYHAGQGRGAKDMVVLPYKDRLVLFSKYLQQLVMESLGKRLDRAGKQVHQGIAVYGNKGSTDQHAYVQQLRDGLNNFFVTFVEVLMDGGGSSITVEDDVTSGDFLNGFLLGTRKALHDAGRESMTITVDEVSARTVGVLIALFERAVGLYASLVNINAYHQPGVEAGKKAAGEVIALQRAVLAKMRERAGTLLTVDGWAEQLRAGDNIETLFKTLEHLAANSHSHVIREAGPGPFDARFGIRT